MSSTPEQNIELAQRADLDNDRLQDGASQADQPESGTNREEDEVRQSAPTTSRVHDKNLEAPEEA